MIDLIYFCIEGSRDQTFLEKIIKPKLIKSGSTVDFYQHAQKTNKRIQNFIRSVNSMDFAAYYFLSDMDENPCYTKVKTNHRSRVSNLDKQKILVANKVIESWILAGQSQKSLNSIGIKLSKKLESYGKIEFERLKPERFKSISAFVQNLLEDYDLTTAVKNSKSLEYFCRKIGLPI